VIDRGRTVKTETSTISRPGSSSWDSYRANAPDTRSEQEKASAPLHLSLNPNLFIEPESRALCVTAIGGGEPSPPSTGGKVWTMTFVMIGWGVLTYTLLALMSYVLEGHLGIAIKTRRMQRQVARTNNHFVLCGYGRVGSEIARDFHSENIACVIIDVNEESLARAAADGYKIVSGSASDTAVLAAAGIDRARGLITAIDNDAENIYVTLSARVLRPDIFIIARANRIDSEPKSPITAAPLP
jgi:voltage-gated potassium channel